LRTKDLDVTTRVGQCREVVCGCLRSHASLQPMICGGVEPLEVFDSSRLTERVVKLPRSTSRSDQSTLVVGVALCVSLLALALAAYVFHQH
jgi:hypothetical protein